MDLSLHAAEVGLPLILQEHCKLSLEIALLQQGINLSNNIDPWHNIHESLQKLNGQLDYELAKKMEDILKQFQNIKPENWEHFQNSLQYPAIFPRQLMEQLDALKSTDEVKDCMPMNHQQELNNKRIKMSLSLSPSSASSSHSGCSRNSLSSNSSDSEKQYSKMNAKKIGKMLKFTPPPNVENFIALNTFMKDGEEMVQLGLNGTAIRKSAFYYINWNLSGPAITRKLLCAMFDRETLANSSLSGKPSPAFTDRPVKGSLDTLAIQDLTFFLTNNLPISAKEVRSSVTTKCADENKMRRLRLMKARKRDAQMNQSLPLMNNSE